MKKEIKKEDKQKLFVINLERILADKGMMKKDLADKLHCTPQTITNYCKRGVSEQQVAEIAAALDVSEKELYRTEAENEFYALKKIDLQKALLATRKRKIDSTGRIFIFSVYYAILWWNCFIICSFNHAFIL